jgi:hypothetical protein
MTEFPSLYPSSRDRTPGTYPHSQFTTANGRNSRVRLSNAVVGAKVRLTFPLLSETQMESVRIHHAAVKGGFEAFPLPDQIWSGNDTPAWFTPSGYRWIYAGRPEIEEINADGVVNACLYNVSIELEAVPISRTALLGATFTVAVEWIPGLITGFLSGATWDVEVSWLTGTIGDPDFSNVSLLLKMDGANGSTSFTDNSSNNVSLTPGGSAAISTTQSKFGGSSFFTGVSTQARLMATSGTNFAFPADFTIECWVYFTQNNVGYQAIMGAYTTGDQTAWVLLIETNNTYAFYGTAGSGWGLTLRTSVVPTLNTWQHIAVSRSGGYIYLYVNGVNSGGGLNSISLASGTNLEIGNYAMLPIGRRAFSGYLDEVRITKGIARYTAAFTPPTEPFPTA